MNQANSSNSSSVESLMKNQQLTKQPIILQPTTQLNTNQQQAPVQISSVSVTALNTSSSSSNLSQQSTSSSTNSTQFTIKPINNLSLSSLALQPQNKPGILTASQQQGITQFKIMTTSSNAANTNQTNQSNIILQTAGSTSSPQQTNTIRKVGSSGNLSNLQQKVQVINSMKPTIQILSNSGQRVTKTTTITTSTNANANVTNSNLPQQYQQVFQQQTTSGTTINLQSLGSGAKAQLLPSGQNTAKTLFASNSNGSGPIQIVQNLQPLLNHQSANTSFAQVLKQFSAVTSSSSSSSPASNSDTASSNSIQIVSLPSTTAKLQTSLSGTQSFVLQPSTSVPLSQAVQQHDFSSSLNSTEIKNSISDISIGDLTNNVTSGQENDDANK